MKIIDKFKKIEFAKLDVGATFKYESAYYIKTHRVKTNDSEYNAIVSDVGKSFDFRKKLYDDYVHGNEFFDGNMSRKRLDEEMRNFNRQMYGG